MYELMDVVIGTANGFLTSLRIKAVPCLTVQVHRHDEIFIG